MYFKLCKGAEKSEEIKEGSMEHRKFSLPNNFSSKSIENSGLNLSQTNNSANSAVKGNWRSGINNRYNSAKRITFDGKEIKVTQVFINIFF